MWHCSVAKLRWTDSTAEEAIALDVLDGYGDSSLGQWREDRPLAFHLRRRLSVLEQAKIGEAVDLRGSGEAQERFVRVKDNIPPAARILALEELRGFQSAI